MEHGEVKPILESVIFVSPSPVKLETLFEILPESNREVILEELHRMKEEYEDPSKGVELVEVAGGYQFRTKPRWAEWVARLKKAKTVKFSQSALETMAIVAYRQPVIRPQIEEIRGVDCGWILRSLMEKGLIKIMGRKDLPGRPIIYGTTKAFLELFNLNSLADLPSLKEIQPPGVLEEIPVPQILEEIPKADVEAEADHEAEVEAQAQDEGRFRSETEVMIQSKIKEEAEGKADFAAEEEGIAKSEITRLAETPSQNAMNE
ncbi:MAG: SMC-Scp complex subunit ScpB [Deltaproteobacteria bacterium]